MPLYAKLIVSYARVENLQTGSLKSCRRRGKAVRSPLSCRERISVTAASKHWAVTSGSATVFCFFWCSSADYGLLFELIGPRGRRPASARTRAPTGIILIVPKEATKPEHQQHARDVRPLDKAVRTLAGRRTRMQDPGIAPHPPRKTQTPPLAATVS